MNTFRERLKAWLQPLGPPAGALVVDAEGQTLDVPCPHGGAARRVRLADVREVAVAASRCGPLMLSLTWVLKTAGQEVRLPLDAEEAETLMRLFQALPGFDTEALSRAVSATAPTVVVCWQRASASGQEEGSP